MSLSPGRIHVEVEPGRFRATHATVEQVVQALEALCRYGAFPSTVETARRISALLGQPFDVAGRSDG